MCSGKGFATYRTGGELYWFITFVLTRLFICVSYSLFLSFHYIQALLFVKAYVEIYAGKLMKQEVSYKTYPQSTHTVMALILVSSISFHIALWPEFGALSMLIMFLLGMFLLNFCLLMPTYVQNLVAFVLITFFLQEYQ